MPNRTLATTINCLRQPKPAVKAGVTIATMKLPAIPIATHPDGVAPPPALAASIAAAKLRQNGASQSAALDIRERGGASDNI
jgi:hypothetical protein